MDLTGRTLWQIGAGDQERVYDDICIKHDVMLVGPGDLGPFDEASYLANWPKRTAERAIRRIRPFYREAKKRDIVLLRLGTGDVRAVGEIVDSPPIWHEEFGDVDGWDLQHVRRVRWFPETNKSFPPKALGGQVKTFATVGVDTVRRWVESLRVPTEHQKRPLANLPIDVGELRDTELGHRLFLEGLPSEYIDNLMSRLDSIRRVAVWYKNKEKRPEGRPSEMETVTYLVVPLLFALGWSQQTVAIGWNNVDAALFDSMPSDDESLTCVIEAKTLGHSVFHAFDQARTYATQPGRKNCCKLVVTDGMRYALYHKGNKDFSLSAYLNVLRMRPTYPVYGCQGAVEAIMGMARLR